MGKGMGWLYGQEATQNYLKDQAKTNVKNQVQMKKWWYNYLFPKIIKSIIFFPQVLFNFRIGVFGSVSYILDAFPTVD